MADDIAWQRRCWGNPWNCDVLAGRSGKSETATITIDWANDTVSIERSDEDNLQSGLSDLQAAAESVDSDGAPNIAVRAAHSAGINWGNMCNWIAGVAGLRHAAACSIVSPWIGLSLGAFWLLVNLEC